MSELPAAEHEALYQSSLLSEERTTLNLTCEMPHADEACDKATLKYSSSSFFSETVRFPATGAATVNVVFPISSLFFPFLTA